MCHATVKNSLMFSISCCETLFIQPIFSVLYFSLKQKSKTDVLSLLYYFND